MVTILSMDLRHFIYLAVATVRYNHIFLKLTVDAQSCLLTNLRFIFKFLLFVDIIKFTSILVIFVVYSLSLNEDEIKSYGG